MGILAYDSGSIPLILIGYTYRECIHPLFIESSSVGCFGILYASKYAGSIPAIPILTVVVVATVLTK